MAYSAAKALTTLGKGVTAHMKRKQKDKKAGEDAKAKAAAANEKVEGLQKRAVERRKKRASEKKAWTGNYTGKW